MRVFVVSFQFANKTIFFFQSVYDSRIDLLYELLVLKSCARGDFCFVIFYVHNIAQLFILVLWLAH